jgi:hypothetical protein
VGHGFSLARLRDEPRHEVAEGFLRAMRERLVEIDALGKIPNEVRVTSWNCSLVYSTTATARGGEMLRFDFSSIAVLGSICADIPEARATENAAVRKNRALEL